MYLLGCLAIIYIFIRSLANSLLIYLNCWNQHIPTSPYAKSVSSVVKLKMRRFGDLAIPLKRSFLTFRDGQHITYHHYLICTVVDTLSMLHQFSSPLLQRPCVLMFHALTRQCMLQQQFAYDSHFTHFD